MTKIRAEGSRKGVLDGMMAAFTSISRREKSLEGKTRLQAAPLSSLRGRIDGKAYPIVHPFVL